MFKVTTNEIGFREKIGLGGRKSSIGELLAIRRVHRKKSVATGIIFWRNPIGVGIR